MTSSQRLTTKANKDRDLVVEYLANGGVVQVIPKTRRRVFCAGFSNTMSFKGHRRVPTTGRY